MSLDNFTGKAEAYDMGRPGYPNSAMATIHDMVTSKTVFADIGAGTGKFTVKLAEGGYPIFAVEPNNDMRKELTKTLGSYENVEIINGTAEKTTLPDKSVDVITIAHALNWFNLDVFREECHRIIKPGGLVIAIYNHLPEKHMDDLYKHTIDEFFSNPNIFEFLNQMTYTREKWIAYIASQDDIPSPSDAEYKKHLDSINATFDRDSIEGVLHLERTTKIYVERINNTL